jgi:hypothetical protein
MHWRATLFVWCAVLGCVPPDDGESNGDVNNGDGDGDGDDGAPATCEAQLTEEACGATVLEPGLRWCAWVSVQTFSDVDACQMASTENRCIAVEDVGNGCSWWSCDQTNYYTRVGEAGTELFGFTPDTCGHEPSHEEGWRQCKWTSGGPMEPMLWNQGQVCDCACGSPPSGTEP